MNDKAMHGLAGAAAALVGLVTVGIGQGGIWPAAITPDVRVAMMFVTVVAGVGKEALDRLMHGDVDPMDAAATVAGGGVMTLLVMLL